MQKTSIAIDGDDATFKTTDKITFIDYIGAAPGHESIRKLLKAAVIEMYGLYFPKYFVTNISPLMS